MNRKIKVVIENYTKGEKNLEKDFNDCEDVLDFIIEQYANGENVIDEFMAAIQITGMSLEEQEELASNLRSYIDGDNDE